MAFPGSELGETSGETGFGGGKPESDFGLVKSELPIAFPRRMLSWQVEIHLLSLA